VTTSRLGGYSLILASVSLFLGNMIPGSGNLEHLENTLSMSGFIGVIFGIFAFSEHLRNNQDNSFLRLAPILAFGGWTASAFGAGISNIEEHVNVESTKAGSMLSGSLFISVGSVGFWVTLIVQSVVFNRPDFSVNVIYKVRTTLGSMLWLRRCTPCWIS
jgi:hypothetical protein